MALAVISGSIISCSKDLAKDTPPVTLNVSAADREAEASYVWIGVNAECQWEISLEFGDAVKPWATLRQTSGNGNDTVACDYEENLSGENRSFIIKLSGKNGSKDERVITQKGLITVSSQPSWIELPAPREDLFFASHSFPYKSGGVYKNVRNYSYGYLPSKRVAIWVAYPLNKFYTGGSATHGDEGWFIDAVLPLDIRMEQPFLWEGSYNRKNGNDYDRGHQCPAADRKCCSEALDQTYYCTNATPQLAEFNQGLWVEVEGRVRAYSSKCDTLYVVTGCIMDGNEYTTDRAGNICPIPGHYYKALLARGGRAGGWLAAGFIFDPVRDRKKVALEQAMICTIDSLEEATGLDFFPNLASIVGEEQYAAIEAANPYSDAFWELK